jgi:hypothetical protein
VPTLSSYEIRQAMLEVISQSEPKSSIDSSLQQGTVFVQLNDRFGRRNGAGFERLVLEEWYQLFNTGYLSWGHDLSNPGPPFCHVTRRGKVALESLSRDPANPAGYLAYLQSKAKLNDVAASYLDEGLDCYVSGHFKASAVMLGAAAESIVLGVRDRLVQRLADIGQPIPNKLNDWRIKTVLDEFQCFVEVKRATLPRSLKDEFFSYWPAFTQHIRAARNEAGHPASVDPVSPETAHASFLMFPLLASLANQVDHWIQHDLK